jgi:hypothetical protein
MATPEEVAARLNAREWEKRKKDTYRKIGARLLEFAQEEAPVGEGDGDHLRDDLEVLISHGKEPIKIRAKTKKALLGMITSGTRPHRIEPVIARALHWTSGGADFFAAYVDHPGTAPNDFLGRAAKEAAPDLEDILRESAEDWLDWVAQA